MQRVRRDAIVGRPHRCSIAATRGSRLLDGISQPTIVIAAAACRTCAGRAVDHIDELEEARGRFDRRSCKPGLN
jgi:hypothetical protein